MWESLGTYNQIFRAFLIALEVATAIIITYWLVAGPMNRMIKKLEALPDGLRTDRPD